MVADIAVEIPWWPPWWPPPYVGMPVVMVPDGVHIHRFTITAVHGPGDYSIQPDRRMIPARSTEAADGR
jgi:hypothetical protein